MYKLYLSLLICINAILNFPFNSQAQTIHDSIAGNMIYINGGGELMQSRFRNNSISHNYKTEYFRNTKAGIVSAGAHYAIKEYDTAYQFKLNLYPEIYKNGYANIMARYSKLEYYPEWRFDAEYFQRLPRDFEASIGTRMNLIYQTKWYSYITMSAAYAFDRYWFSIRSNIRTKTFFTSFELTARKYFENANSFLTMYASTKRLPEQNFMLNEELMNKFSLSLDLQKRLANKIYYKVQLSYGKGDGFYLFHRYRAEAGLKFLF